MDAITRRTLRLVSDDYPEYEPDDKPPRRRGRQPRPSVGLRVALTVSIATLLVCIGGAGYLAVKSGILDPIISPPREVAAAAPAAVEASPAVTDAPAAAAPTDVAAAEAVAAQPAAPAPPATAPVPDTSGLVVMIRSAIVALNQANTSGDYSVLWAMAAPDLQQRNTPAGLSEAFADLRGRNLDLGVVTAVNPSLYAPPALNAQGLLRLNGFIPTGADKTDFDLIYQTVGGHWRLIGMAVNPPKAPEAGAKPAASAPKAAVDAARKVPEPARLVELIRQAVLGLNQANARGNYSVFRGNTAAGFQAANDLPHLATQFAALRGRGLDLSPIAVIPPALAKPPAIDKNGYLRVVGYFPSRPEQVSFDLMFAFERAQWRLFGIGVESSPPPPEVMAPAADSP